MTRMHHHSIMRETTYLTLGAVLLGVVLLVVAQDSLLVYAQSGPVISDLTPTDGSRYAVGDMIPFHATTTGRAGVHTVKLYVALGQVPTSGDLVTTASVNNRAAFSYSLDTRTYAAGTYYWYVTSTDSLGTAQSDTLSFILTPAPTAERETTTSTPPATRSQSARGGKGGATAGPSGEKVAFFGEIKEGESRFLSLGKWIIHGVEKIWVKANAPLPSNALLVYQRLPPQDGMPTDLLDVYKTLDVRSVNPWKPGSFSLALYLKYPVERLKKLGLEPKDVRVLYFTGKEWKPIPVALASENTAYYTFVTKPGLYPIVLGAGKK